MKRNLQNPGKVFHMESESDTGFIKTNLSLAIETFKSSAFNPEESVCFYQHSL